MLSRSMKIKEKMYRSQASLCWQKSETKGKSRIIQKSLQPKPRIKVKWKERRKSTLFQSRGGRGGRRTNFSILTPCPKRKSRENRK